jgi:xanthine dehydrogenase accessory factor
LSTTAATGPPGSGFPPLTAVGLLGSRERSRRLAEEVFEAAPALAASAHARLRAPVGLDIGADGPQEIALSIVAELVAARSGRAGRPLTEVRSAIPFSLTAALQ